MQKESVVGHGHDLDPVDASVRPKRLDRPSSACVHRFVTVRDLRLDDIITGKAGSVEKKKSCSDGGDGRRRRFQSDLVRGTGVLLVVVGCSVVTWRNELVPDPMSVFVIPVPVIRLFRFWIG